MQVANNPGAEISNIQARISRKRGWIYQQLQVDDLHIQSPRHVSRLAIHQAVSFVELGISSSSMESAPSIHRSRPSRVTLLKAFQAQEMSPRQVSYSCLKQEQRYSVQEQESGLFQ
jgi:hypothetical protein